MKVEILHEFASFESPTVDWPHPNVLRLKPQAGRSFHPTFFTINKILIKKNTSKKNMELEMRWDEINISTDVILHININLFAVQQSIDHIQMSFGWSQKQCGPSTLHLFTINKILI